MDFKKIMFFVLIAQAISQCLAQNNLISIHSSIGDTIDRTEKIKYVLFEEIKNEDYLFSIVSINQADTSITYYKKIDSVKIKITGKEISAITYNINRLNVFYNSNGETSDPNFIRNPSSASSSDDNRSINAKNLEPDKYEKRMIKLEKGVKTRPKEWDKLNGINNQYNLMPMTPPTYQVPKPVINIPTPQPVVFPH